MSAGRLSKDFPGPDHRTHLGAMAQDLAPYRNKHRIRLSFGETGGWSAAASSFSMNRSENSPGTSLARPSGETRRVPGTQPSRAENRSPKYPARRNRIPHQSAWRLIASKAMERDKDLEARARQEKRGIWATTD